MFREMASKIESQKRQLKEFQAALQIKNSVIENLEKVNQEKSKIL